MSVRTIRNLERGAGARRSTMVLLMDALSLTDAERLAVGPAVGSGAARLHLNAGEDGRSAQRMDTPRQLPAGVAGFAARAAELARLDEILGGVGTTQTGVAVCVVVGVAGVGKTALAVHWAHRSADRFPDGQLYVNLRGFDPGGSVSPSEALWGFLGAFGVPPRRVPADLDGQAALYRSLLAGRRVLVVLDNARDAEQVRPLLPGSPPCAVVVTSRDALRGLISGVAAHSLTLGLPDIDEARQLLAKRLGGERVLAEPQAVAQIITRCARLPLALSVVAARAVANDGFPLAAFADQLCDASRDLGVFGGSDPATDVRAVFSWSYRTLSSDAARLFRLVASHPGPDIATPAVASLAGLTTGQARRLLTELDTAHLLIEDVPGRHRFHDLLRAYAVELGQAIDSADDRRAAQHRLLDHYLHTIHQAGALMHPRQDPLVLAPPQPGVTPEDLDDHESAMAWFTAERPVLLAAVEQAHEAGFATHTWQLSWALTEPLCRSGRWQELASCQRTALEAAQRLGDPARQAYAHHRLGGACTHLGRYADAHAHLEQALHRFAELRDDTGEAHTHQDLVVLLTTQGRHEEALRHAEQALWLYQSADHRAGQASALNNIGWGHTLLGNPEQGVSSCTRALALQREIGDRRSEADTLDSLGYAYHHLGNYAHARTHYEQALTLYRELGVWHSQADTLTRLGDTHEAAGDTDAAERVWLQALSILDQHDHSETERIHTKLRHLAPTL